MVSVAMTTYNGAAFLFEQLLSIYEQSQRVDELIVCDDGSSDQTMAILMDFQQTHPDFCMRIYQNQKNLGYKLNFKQAMSYCSGDYIFLCDQDDIWDRQKVEIMVRTMIGRPHIQVLASSFTFVDAQGNPVSIQPLKGYSNNNLYTRPVDPGALVPVGFDEFLAHNYFQGCSLCIKKALVDRVVAHFSVKIHHDWLINALAAMQEGMYFLNRPLFAYRMHAHNAVGIPDIGRTRWRRVFNKKGLVSRIHVAQEALWILDALNEVDPDPFIQRGGLEKRRQFYIRYIGYLEHKQVGRLLLENRKAIYRQTIGLKGRLLDIWFVVLSKI